MTRLRNIWPALCLLALGACHSREEPSAGSLRLAVGLVRHAGLEAERAWSEVDPESTLLPAESPSALWVRSRIPAARWTRVEGRAGVWSTPLPFLGVGDAEGVAARLTANGKEYEPALWRARRDKPLPPGFFRTQDRVLYATTEDPDGPGEAASWEQVELGRDDGEVCRVRVEAHEAEGFLLLPGFPCTFALEPGGPSELVFQSCTIGAGSPVLELRLGEDWIQREELDAAPRPRDGAHRIALPARAAPRTLEFRLEGAPAVCAILAPTLTPQAAPQPVGGVVPGSVAPDVFLFVADTFRADNLEAYGGAPFLTPELDRFAREGLVFTRALAPSPWTLPSHAALFTGLYPPELGVRTTKDALAPAAATLAEALLAAGYRTAAITDDAFVSPGYGLAQGFELFDARRRAPHQTLEAVERFLACDDARPAFLVTHTYRAHQPYSVSAETRKALGTRLGLRPELEESDYRAVPRSISGWTPDYAPTAAEEQRMSDYRALYRGASADLDRLFGAFLERLRKRARPALVIFTSDHGEAFWEHGVAEHGNGVWNEHLRIPLVLWGAGIAPGSMDALASLVDLPRTLARLAGVPADPQWGGVDLLGAPVERSVFAFQCDLHGNPSSLALFAGDLKLVLSDPEQADPEQTDPEQQEPVLQAAFDLRADPGERRNLVAEPRVLELLGTHAAALLAARQRKLDVGLARPDASALEELGQLGYGR